MQEIHRLCSDSISHLGKDFYWTYRKDERQHVVGIAIWKSSDILIDNISYQSEKLLTVDIVVPGCSIKGISVYAPTV